jgi:FkbM family methyltransferase
MANYLSYNTIQVPFNCLGNGGIDTAIKVGAPVGTERELYTILIKPGDVCYDIGAYIGTHAIQFALLGGIVYAFEPSVHNFSRCVEHCKPFRQIKVFDVGFHEKSYVCETKFKDCNNKKAEDGDPIQTIKYEVLDDFIQKSKIPSPDFIKIDVEGMETSILKSFDKILKVYRPTLHIEIHYAPNTTIQNYPDNPHWKTPDQGGFDFNLFYQKYFYYVFKCDGKSIGQLDYDKDLNNLSGIPSIVCVPVEKVLKEDYK